MPTLTSLVAQWNVLDRLLDQALVLPTRSERDAWLARLAPEHAALRPALTTLLKAQDAIDAGHAALPETLPPLRIDVGEAPAPAGATVAPGDAIGPYVVQRELGRGGMGAVWLAERADGVPRRQVALKLPRIAWGEAIATRLARERDILAGLEHPGIARLYDAGVDALGRPYLAMEFVDGQPIDAWCDARSLSLRQRAALLIEAAAAVAFAHRRLVVHRDLKPSNILVAADGHVRLVDFGIARLVADDAAPADAADAAAHTATAQALTLDYASPEQIEGQRLSTATDVYSLGVVAHELLCGTRPFASLRERGLLRLPAVVTQDPPRPSAQPPDAPARLTRGLDSPAAWRRAIEGDLDAILLRALARRPEARYASVEAFATDLQRWCDGHPVSARAPRLGYRLRRFAGRHRLGVALGSAAVAGLLGTASAAVWFGLQAQAQGQRAQASRNFLVGLFERADPDLRGGREATLRELLEPAQTAAEQLPPSERREVWQTIARLWVNLGDTERAGQAQARVSADSAADGGLAQAESLVEEARIAIMSQRTGEAERALAAAERALASDHWPASLRALGLEMQGWVHLHGQQVAEARSRFVAALQQARNARDAEREAWSLYGLVAAQQSAGDADAAAASLEQLAARLENGAGVSLRARLELRSALMSALYREGRYAEGWSGLKALLDETHSLYSGAVAQLRPRSYWMRYALELDRTNEVAGWLRAQPAIGGPVTGYAPEEVVEWHALAARIHARERDDERARTALQEARIALGAIDAARRHEESSRLALHQARVALALDRGPEAAASLERTTALPPALVPYRDWLRAAVEAHAGRAASAQIWNERSLAALRRELGPRHPDVLLLQVNAVLLALAAHGTPTEDEMTALSAGTTLLRTAYGEEHRWVALSRRLAAELSTLGQPIDEAQRNRLSQAAGSALSQIAW